MTVPNPAPASGCGCAAGLYRPGELWCQTLHIPTGMVGVNGEPAQMWAQLCVPDGATKVMVLLHGATYNHLYWDMHPEERYSFLRQAWDCGWATLAVDAPGHGWSTIIEPAQATAEAVSAVYAQVVTDLRAGTYGPVLANVMLVGHSAGTALILYTIQNHPELTDQVAGLVLTGMTHMPKLSDLAVPADAMHPANTEPRFSNIPDGWLTTIPGFRDELWWSSSSPRELPTEDELVLKDYFAPIELVGAHEYWVQPVTVPVPPVLTVIGAQDRPFCWGASAEGRCHDAATLLANERPYYPAGTDLTTHVVPGDGHSISWDRRATSVILDWATSKVQQGAAS